MSVIPPANSLHLASRLLPVGGLLRLAGCLLISLSAVMAGGSAQGTMLEEFEGPETRFTVRSADVAYRIESHARQRMGAYRGGGCERIRMTAAPGGTQVLFGADIQPARVIPELAPSLMVQTDRVGVQLMARVVLPRTVDPRTGRAVVTLLRGSSSAQIGNWERLALADLPTMVARQARVLRSQIGVDIDEREAYIDQILLNIYGGAGLTDVLIDDLEVVGLLAVNQAQLAATGPPGGTPGAGNSNAPPVADPSRAGNPFSPPPVASIPSAWSPAPNPSGATLPASLPVAQSAPTNTTGLPRVHTQGPVLLVDGRPFFPNMIEHRGESFDQLQRLGFNTVRLAVPPTAVQLEEAARLDLWIVSPPPPLEGRVSLGVTYARVLAWDLGGGLAEPQLAATRLLADRVRLADSALSRPLVCAPEAELRAYSRVADLLLLSRPVFGSSFELNQLERWLQARPRLARLGVPVWTEIETEPSVELLNQIQAFAPGAAPALNIEAEQLRLGAFAAVAGGAHGVCFRSRRSLAGEDPLTRRRASSLELVNHFLNLIEPWAAAGTNVTAVDVGIPDVRLAALETERSRLLLVTHTAQNDQFTVAPPAADPLSFVVPGVPNSSNVYHVTPALLTPLRHQRVTGGTRVTLDRPELISLVVLTQDPVVIGGLTRRIAASGDRIIRLTHEIAQQTLQETEAIEAMQQAYVQSVPQRQVLLQQAKVSLQQSQRLLDANTPEQAYRNASQAMHRTLQLRRGDWERAVSDFPTPVASPCCMTFASLPVHWALADRLRGATISANLLAGGEFEDLSLMVRNGWRHARLEVPGLQSHVELSPTHHRTGRFSLRLACSPVDPQLAPELVESPPVWVTSGDVPVRPGQIVRVHGWIRLARPITGSQDSLLIFDSLAGKRLATRIEAAEDWQEFTLYRAAGAADSRVNVTIALTGLGEAYLDDLSITAFQTPAAAMRPSAGSAPAPR